MAFGYKDADLAHTDFQYIEEMATAYWYSEVLFGALDLKLFYHLEQGTATVSDLACAASCQTRQLHRLLRALEQLALVGHAGGAWFNAQIASCYLVPGKPSYMGDLFHYRRYMQPRWAKVAETVSNQPNSATPVAEALPSDYKTRNLQYVRAMDQLAKHKAREIAALLTGENIRGPILDVGGGAGSMVRALAKKRSNGNVLLDLPEVLEAARILYPQPEGWQGIRTVAGDFRNYAFNTPFGLIVLSNFLHAYGPDEAKTLLFKAVSHLADGGMLLIHDYFPDRRGKSTPKGALYDLAMMLNTYNGECHEAGTITQWLGEVGVDNYEIVDLTTDSAVIVAGSSTRLAARHDNWVHIAHEMGFQRAVSITSSQVVTAPWVRMKCRCGCAQFGRNLQCPPHGMSNDRTRQLLDTYQTAVLVEGSPPGKQFHEMLLNLEKKAFLDGFHKAFVLSAGPCPVCPSCPDDGRCRHPDLARPSMEGSGIDVYTTARSAGLALSPVQSKQAYVKYIGLLVLE